VQEHTQSADRPPPAADLTLVRSPAVAISNAVVGLVRDYTGRGPTKARTAIAGDMIIVTLRECLTKAERTLAQHGQAAEARAMRRALHETMREDLISTVETLTGRSVDALLSDSLSDPDIVVKVFVLRPETDGAHHS
jgi:uncharacterized protein YbcI